jgi:hypothetical protein
LDDVMRERRANLAVERQIQRSNRTKPVTRTAILSLAAVLFALPAAAAERSRHDNLAPSTGAAVTTVSASTATAQFQTSTGSAETPKKVRVVLASPYGN